MTSKPWETDLSVYPDEAALLAGLRGRERDACSCMLKHHGPHLYRLALRLTGDADAAEDVLQEAFIRSCARIDTFQGLSSLGTWLHRIVVTSALMHLRAAPQRHSTNQDAVPLDSLTDTHATPDAEVLTTELREQLERAVLALPDTLRTAFVLRELEGMSTADAAATLGISTAALKVRLHRARAALRTELSRPFADNDALPSAVEARLLDQLCAHDG